jgi:hypothetical protein
MSHAMRFYWLILGVLGVWRITHLLQAEDGPYEIVVRLRQKAGHGFWGKLLDCFYCLSLWIALPFAAELGGDAREQLLLWPALSAAAILLERITVPAAAAYTEDEEEKHGMLREPENASYSGDGHSPAS